MVNSKIEILADRLEERGSAMAPAVRALWRRRRRRCILWMLPHHCEFQEEDSCGVGCWDSYWDLWRRARGEHGDGYQDRFTERETDRGPWHGHGVFQGFGDEGDEHGLGDGDINFTGCRP